MRMLNPDLLDRRALALVELRDPFGRRLPSPARIEGDGLRVVAKGGGRFAIVAAAGFASHESAFFAAPAPDQPISGAGDWVSLLQARVAPTTHAGCAIGFATSCDGYNTGP